MGRFSGFLSFDSIFCNFKFAVVLATGIGYIMNMKRSEMITAVCLLGGLLFNAGVKAVGTDPKDNSYSVIPDRNVFGLKPPPETPKEPPPPTNQPANQIQLSGITTIVSPKRAILQWKDPAQPPTPGTRPVAPGKEQSYIMVEGQREGIIEVIEINEKAGSVRIKNAGEPMLLTFETHGAKLPNTPPPVAQPGAVPSPVGAVPTGVGGTVPGNVNAAVNPGVPGYNRPVGGIPNPASGGVYPAASGLTTVPTRPMRSSPYTSPSAYNPPVAPHQQPGLTAETQPILIEIERERTKGQVASGDLPPLPPTELTPPPE